MKGEAGMETGLIHLNALPAPFWGPPILPDPSGGSVDFLESWLVVSTPQPQKISQRVPIISSKGWKKKNIYIYIY